MKHWYTMVTIPRADTSAPGKGKVMNSNRPMSEKLIIIALLIAVAALAFAAALSFVVARSFAREPVCSVVLTAGVTIGEDGRSVDVSTGTIHNPAARPSGGRK